LLHPDIRRIPVDPTVQKELAETLLPELRAALHFSWSRYEPELASRRYWQVNELFEAFIGRDFLRRRDLWRRLRAQTSLSTVESAGIHRLLSNMPVTDADASASLPGRATLLGWQAQSQRLLDAAEVRLQRVETR
jgi:phosphoglycerate transport regulatory protein PgtC